jgi:HAE1 family hydrophobic/amphiphilic exporter-1
MSNICKIFIDRPVATIVLMASLFIFGWFAYKNLPISEMPNVDFPTIVVKADLPGADPETMATTVATPLEKQFSTISDIDSMSSISTAGTTKITLQFGLDRNIDAAAQDVQSAISQATRKLPQQMPNPPSMNKMSADSPILFVALTGDNVSLTDLDDIAENTIAPQMSMADGVAQVNVYGSQQYAVRIRINPNAIVNRGLSVDQVASAIKNLNANQPTGTLQTNGYYQSIKVNGQLYDADEFANAVVATNNGAPVRLKDIATVQNSASNDKIATWVNDKHGIVLAIQRQPGANTIAVAKNVEKLLPSFAHQLPNGAHLQVVYDKSNFIKSAISDVQYTLLFAALLVVGVIFLFFNEITPTIIVVLSLPISIVASFGVMYLLGYTIDNLSLMALVLAVGFVIDDAVVVLENIMRHVEHGLNRFEASIKGSKEIGFTVVAMTLSLVAVFIPIFFMQGVIGRLFHEFAAVVGIAILFSGLVSLTFVPMLCSRFLADGNNLHVTQSAFEKLFSKCRCMYEESLRWAITHRKFMLNIVLLILVATGWLFHIVPKGFIPSEDTDILFATIKAPAAITFPEFSQEQQQVAAIILKNSNVKSIISSVGQNGTAAVSSNAGRIIIDLKPKSSRKLTADQIIQQLRMQLKNEAGLKILVTNPAAINVGSKSTNSNYQYVLQGSDIGILQQAATQMQQQIKQIPGVHGVDSDLELDNPELRVNILRDKAANLGISPEQIENALYLAYGEGRVSSIATANGDYDVIMDIDPQFQQTVDDLSNLNLTSTSGKMIPLPAVADISEGVGTLEMDHSGQLPAVTLSFNLVPGASLGNISDQINHIAKNNLPSGVTGMFAGTAKTFQDSLTSLPLLLFFTILVIYMVLAILYENFIHPITILTALPFAIFGALFAILLFNQELDIFSFIGIIMLVGLTKKNGIMMVDFAVEAERTQKLSPAEAIIHACSIRFRPIMMTTVAAILATLPIALGFGAGGETRMSLGVSVVGGLFFSQLITLYITPIFYLVMSNLSHRAKKVVGVMVKPDEVVDGDNA